MCFTVGTAQRKCRHALSLACTLLESIILRSLGPFWQVPQIELHTLPKCYCGPFPLPSLLLSFMLPVLCSLPDVMLCSLPYLPMCCLSPSQSRACHTQKLCVPAVALEPQVGHLCLRFTYNSSAEGIQEGVT